MNKQKHIETMKTKVMMASAAALAALLLLPGCQREKLISEEAQDGVKTESVALWFEGTNGPATRVDIDGTSGAGTWTEGDRIALWVSGTGANFYQNKAITEISGNTGHVMVSLAGGQNRANFAIYPASAAVEDHHSSSDLYIKYPDTYDYSGIPQAQAETYTPAPMVAINNPVSGSTVPDLNFYHVGGVLRLTVPNIPGSARRLVITFPEGMKFHGTYKVTNGGTATATLTDVGTETNRNVITVILPILENATNDLTFNLPTPMGDYTPTTAGDRAYTVMAYSESIAFMAGGEFVNWASFLRAEGKKAESSALETLGTMNGYYLTRGLLYRPDNSSVAPSDMSLIDPMEATTYYNRISAFSIYFTWPQLGRIMTGDSSFDGSYAFPDETLTIGSHTYRVPSRSDWEKIVYFDRPGSTVNGTQKCRFSRVIINLTGSQYVGHGGTMYGALYYPDGGQYTCSSLTYFNSTTQANTISYADYRRLCTGENACLFLPALGQAYTNNGSTHNWDNWTSAYWTATLANASNAFTYGSYQQPFNLNASYNLTTDAFPVCLLRVD